MYMFQHLIFLQRNLFFLIKKFENQSVIFTQVSRTAYDGAEFQDGGVGYYYFVVDGNFIPSRLTVSGEKVVLV